MTLLCGDALARVRALDLTYGAVGASDPRDATAGAEVPPGYHQLVRRLAVGSGAAAFARASSFVLGWGMQRGAGFKVSAQADPVELDTVALLRLGVGPLAISAPVRVMWVVSESRRVGFGYGTLSGHPVSGEEAFVVELADSGSVVATVSAFSRPASLATRIAGPVGRVGQAVMARRYLRAV